MTETTDRCAAYASDNRIYRFMQSDKSVVGIIPARSVIGTRNKLVEASKRLRCAHIRVITHQEKVYLVNTNLIALDRAKERIGWYRREGHTT